MAKINSVYKEVIERRKRLKKIHANLKTTKASTKIFLKIRGWTN